MASRLNPYISFADTARPAMEFYREVFGGTLTLSTFGDFGDKQAPGAEPPARCGRVAWPGVAREVPGPR